MKNNNQYWVDRFLEEEKRVNRDARIYAGNIEKQYDRALKIIEEDINNWYNRIAKNNNISLLEAQKMLSAKELKEFKWDVNEYIKRGQENAVSGKWIKELENASAKAHISRLDALKLQIQNEIESLYGARDKQMADYIARTYSDSYYHSIFEVQKGTGVGSSFAALDKRRINTVINKPWAADGKNFSDRIWEDKTKLVNTLHNGLTQSFIRGDSPDKLIANIAKEFDVKKSVAARLVMTESAAYSSKAQQDAYITLGVDKYEIVATLDSRTSEICREMDGKIFDTKDYQVGVTANPFHVWCRTTTVPWYESLYDETRIARGEDGKTYKVPGDITYKEWKKEYVNKDGIKEIIKVFKTFEEAKEVLGSKNVFIDDNLEKLDRELFLENASKLNEMLEKYDIGAQFARDKKFIFEASSSKEDFLGCCITNRYDGAKQTIQLNPKYFKNYKEYVSGQMKQSLSGFKMPTLESRAQNYTITHEFGHYIENILFEMEKNKNKAEWDLVLEKAKNSKRPKAILDKWYNGKATTISKKIIEIAKTLDGEETIKSCLSKYGETNHYEFFAECFANMEGGKPNKLGKAMELFLKEVLK